MDLGAIFKEGAGVLRKNYILAVPTVIATFAVAFLSLGVVKSPEALGALAAMAFVSMILNYFAHGVTVAMAGEAIDKGQTSLGTGLKAASSHFYQFLAASVVLSAVVTLGFVLLVVPGLVAMFFLMFVFPAILRQGLGPADAMRASYRLVRANVGDALTLFIALGAMTAAIAFLNLALMEIPVVGQFTSVVINGAFGGFSAAAVLRAYMTLSSKREQISL